MPLTKDTAAYRVNSSKRVGQNRDQNYDRASDWCYIDKVANLLVRRRVLDRAANMVIRIGPNRG